LHWSYFDGQRFLSYYFSDLLAKDINVLLDINPSGDLNDPYSADFGDNFGRYPSSGSESCGALEEKITSFESSYIESACMTQTPNEKPSRCTLSCSRHSHAPNG